MVRKNAVNAVNAVNVENIIKKLSMQHFKSPSPIVETVF